MLRLIKRFWNSVWALGGFIGIIYLWSDIVALPEALRPPAEFVRQNWNVVLICFAGLLALRIVWIDVHPNILQWWRAHRSPLLIEFPPEINNPATYGPNKRSYLYVSNDAAGTPPVITVTIVNYFLGVSNVTSRTIKNVSVHVHELKDSIISFPEFLLTTQDNKTTVDIRPGFTEYFALGLCKYNNSNAPAESFVPAPSQRVKELKSDWNEYTGFRLMGGRRRVDMTRSNGSGFVLGLYGEDVVPSKHLFVINAKDKFEIFYKGILDAGASPLRVSS